MYTVYIWLESWYLWRKSIVFAKQLPFDIMIKSAKCYIYQNYIKCFYPLNFDKKKFHTLLKWNKWKSIINLFSKVYTHIINKHAKLQTIWRKNTFEFCCLIGTHATIFHKKIQFDKLPPLCMQNTLWHNIHLFWLLQNWNWNWNFILYYKINNILC